MKLLEEKNIDFFEVKSRVSFDGNSIKLWVLSCDFESTMFFLVGIIHKPLPIKKLQL